jgi:phosphate-selective porin
MFRSVKMLVASLMLSLALAAQSFAAMSPADVTATTTGISDSLTLFYTIGGTILVVLAGIWGFRKITGLLGK